MQAKNIALYSNGPAPVFLSCFFFSIYTVISNRQFAVDEVLRGIT